MFREAWLIRRERPLRWICSARSSAPLARSRSVTCSLLHSISSGLLSSWEPLGPLSSRALPSIVQAALSDDAVLVFPGVSRTHGPLDGALVLQLLDGLVVADTVRPDANALSRCLQGQVRS
jgi:hypothetical protein